MQIEPPASAFAKRYARGEPQIVWTTLVADLETPVSAFLKLRGDESMSFLLKSVEGGETRGRYSIIGLNPDLIWRSVGGRAEIKRNGEGGFISCRQTGLAGLREVIAESRVELPDTLPPMAAGKFGYLGYEMVRLMEKLPQPNPDPIGIPDAVLVRPTIVLVFDTVTDTMTVVTPVRPDADLAPDKALAGATERLAAIVRALDLPSLICRRAQSQRRSPSGLPPTPKWPSTRAWCAQQRNTLQPATFFRWCCRSGSRRRSSCRHLRSIALSGASIQHRFFTFSISKISPSPAPAPKSGARARRHRHLRPLAGTRPRGATPQEDKRLELELLADEKERAEHLMLLDLGRNDVGRVARTASVTVTDQFSIERFSQVMHIVSNVEGKLDPAKDAVDALIAGFPAGTVSGAPKVRAMEIIDELEKEKRGSTPAPSAISPLRASSTAASSCAPL